MKNIFILFALMSANAFATGGKVGSGGDALKVGDKLFVLDLLEAGAEERPYFDDSVVVDQKILNLFAGSLNELKDPDQATINDKIARKLSELAVHDRMFAASIAVVIKRFNWTLVNIPLDDIQDEDSLLKYDQKDLVQVAVRRDNFIKISRKDWNALDLNNRAAIILHEALYALIKPKEIGIEKMYNGKSIHTTKQVQISSKAREVNGFLFSKHLDDENFERLATLAKNDFPIGFGCPSGKFKMRVYVGTWKGNDEAHFSYNYLNCNPSIKFASQEFQKGSTSVDKLSSNDLSFEIDDFEIQKIVAKEADNLETEMKTVLKNYGTVAFEKFFYNLDLTARSTVGIELAFRELDNNPGFFYYSYSQSSFAYVLDFNTPVEIADRKLSYDFFYKDYNRATFTAAIEERLKLVRDYGFKKFDF